MTTRYVSDLDALNKVSYAMVRAAELKAELARCMAVIDAGEALLAALEARDVAEEVLGYSLLPSGYGSTAWDEVDRAVAAVERAWGAL